MALPLTLSNGLRIQIIVRGATRNRLTRTCFRGTDRRLAGNFSTFVNSEDVLQNESVLSGLRPSIMESFREFREVAEEEKGTRLNTFSETIQINHVVGWESTGSLGDYNESDLEPFHPNGRSHALRVKLDRIDILAPKTDLVTIIYEIEHKGRNPNFGWNIIIHSMYPGVDIGDLYDDITEREKRIFFHWNHPGEE